TPSSLGDNTDGTWELYFDGSDVGLEDRTDEDIDALIIRSPDVPGAMPILYLSTLGNFDVPGVSGAGEDVFSFEPTSLCPDTAGTYGPGLGLQGSLFGLTPFGLDGIAVDSLGKIVYPPGGGGGFGGFGGMAAGAFTGPGFPAGGTLAPDTGGPSGGA